MLIVSWYRWSFVDYQKKILGSKFSKKSTNNREDFRGLGLAEWLWPPLNMKIFLMHFWMIQRAYKKK